MDQIGLQKNSSAKEKPIPLMLCPFCLKSIPSLLFYPFKGQMDIKVRCECLQLSKESFKVLRLRGFMLSLTSREEERAKNCCCHNEGEREYCVKCLALLCRTCLKNHLSEERYMHELCDSKLYLQCIQHKKPFSNYCKNCNEHRCLDCQGNHFKHTIIPLSISSQYQTSYTDYFNARIANNRLLTNKLIQRILTHSQTPTEINAHLQSACTANESINSDLILLYHCICKTLTTFKAYPTYELMQLQSIVINAEQYREEEALSIEEECNKLIGYLQKQYVLKQMPTNECIASFKENTVYLYSLLELSDGRLAAGSFKSIKLWNTTTDDCTLTLKGHDHSVMCLLQLKDGRLASGSMDNTIKLWSAFRRVISLKGHNNGISCLIQLADGRLASSSYDCSIKIWSLFSNECIATLREDSKPVSVLLQLADGRLAYKASGMIALWNSTFSKRIHLWTGKAGTVCLLIQMKDGNLASTEYMTILLLSTSSNTLFASLKRHWREILCLIQLRDGRLASGSIDKTIILWSTTTCQRIAIFRGGNSDPVFCLMQLDDGRLVSCSNSIINLWNLTTNNRLIASLRGRKGENINLLQLSEGRLATCSKIFNKINLWDI